MGKTLLKYKHPEYLFVQQSTGSASWGVNGGATEITFTPPTGYEYCNCYCYNTPNPNWFIAFAYKLDGANKIRIAFNNIYGAAITGMFTVTIIYKYVGGAAQ